MNKFLISKSKTNEFPVVIGEEPDLKELTGGKETVFLTENDSSEVIFPALDEDIFYIVRLKKQHFREFLELTESSGKEIKWILAPVSPMEIVYNGGVPYFTYPDAIFIDLGYLTKLSTDDFYEVIAYTMRLGMENSTNLYGYVINHLYELCDLDYETVEELFTMIYKVHERIMTRKTKEERMKLSLPEVMGDFYDSLGLYKHSDAIAYGCINGAYYAYRNEFISTEDYYEIRDMFVPFGISIMQTKKNKAELLNHFRSFLSERKTDTDILSMKKIGKLDQPVDFDRWLDEELFTAVFFDEEENN